MKIADNRHPHAELVQAIHDLRYRRGCLLRIHRHPHQFRAGSRQRHYLIHGPGHIRRIGIGHRLNNNRMIAANHHTRHIDNRRRAAQLYCHRTSKGNSNFSIPALPATARVV